MPILDGQGNPLGPDSQAQVGGFSWSQIIEIVEKRTEKRATQLDMNAELAMALQEFCLETRWWWRRRVTQFDLVAGLSTYDLQTPDTINAPDMQQVAAKGLKIFRSSASKNYMSAMPVFDVDEQDLIIGTQALFPSDIPTRFFFFPGNTLQIWFDPIPSDAFPVTMAFWALPNNTPDSYPEGIPLVPGYLHHLIIKRLEARVFSFTGSMDKYKIAQGEYTALVDRAKAYRNFSDGEVRSIASQICGDAIQST